jgi:hypothetical protein
MNRETWINQLCKDHIWPWLKPHGGKPPKKWRVSLGFPKGSRGGKGGHAIGQCWAQEASGDGAVEVFISPELTAKACAATLVHELIHAAVGVKEGHKGKFKKLAKAAGLIGRMRATTPGAELADAIDRWISIMPKFPHAPLTIPDGKKVGPGSRMIKIFCPDCGYTLRTTRTWIEIAVPKCPNPECEDASEPMITEGT